MTTPVQIPLTPTLKDLSLNGVCSYYLNDETLYLDVAEIASRRVACSLSGSLSLEVWALSAPYSGGDFSGYRIASQHVGQLSGQNCFRNCSYVLPIEMPGEGIWSLVLMLREWDQTGNVTRDYINFPQQVVAKSKMTLNLYCS
jgi:hypothetical protein